MPQLPLVVPVLLGAQPLAPVQLPHAPQPPQPQVALQVRDRLCVPLSQLPQLCEPCLVSLGAQAEPPVHVPQSPQSPQTQVASHVLARSC